MSHLQILPSIEDRADPLVNRFLDMREKFRWMMGMGGERVLLYKRRFSGTLCSQYDKIRRQHRQDPIDTECFGTNFVGGYFGPFAIFVSLKTAQSQQRIRFTEQGLRREFITTNWALWEPKLNNKDFIVRRNNQRLWINQIEETKWRHHILRQLFQTEEIERNNLIYKIPIAGLPDFQTGVTCPVIP